MRVDVGNVFARIIQAAYVLLLAGLFFALVTDGMKVCIGAACREQLLKPSVRSE